MALTGEGFAFIQRDPDFTPQLLRLPAQSDRARRAARPAADDNYVSTVP